MEVKTFFKPSKDVTKIVLQDRKECYKTGSTSNLHKHHIFCGNAKRRISDRYGLYVWLRYDWHNGSNYGVHNNKEFDLELRRFAQEEFEKVYSRELFIKLFDNNYLEVEE